MDLTRVEEGKASWFQVNRSVRPSCILVYILALCIYKTQPGSRLFEPPIRTYDEFALLCTTKIAIRLWFLMIKVNVVVCSSYNVRSKQHLKTVPDSNLCAIRGRQSMQRWYIASIKKCTSGNDSFFDKSFEQVARIDVFFVRTVP